MVSDYYSNFIEVEHLNNATTSTVSKALKSMFARYGVPDVLISDNGPQFASEEFARFAQKWGFEHITSSPHYPQSNRNAENSVKTVKRLQGEKLFRVYGSVRLAEYTYRGFGVKLSPKIAGSTV